MWIFSSQTIKPGCGIGGNQIAKRRCRIEIQNMYGEWLVWRFDPGQELSWKGPTGHCRVPTS